MKHCLSILTLLLASTLCGCTALSGFPANPDSSAAKLQSVLRMHPNPSFNALTVTESNGVLQVYGFVNNFRQKDAVNEFISGYAPVGDQDYTGQIINRVVLSADYDCRDNGECLTKDKCIEGIEQFSEYKYQTARQLRDHDSC